MLAHFPPTRIIVNLRHQLLYSAPTVAHDTTGYTLRDGYELTAHNQHAIVVTLYKVLDNGNIARSAQLLVGIFYALVLGNAYCHQPAHIAGQRLHHHGISNAFGRSDGLPRTAHNALIGHR